MAQGRSVKSFAGFRTRISDRVDFVEPSEMAGRDSSDWTGVIAPEQLVWVGVAQGEPATAEPHQAGEWGRVGPRSSTAKPGDVASIAAREPLSEEDASARSMIADSSSKSISDSPMTAGIRTDRP